MKIHITQDDFCNATPIFVARIYESIVRQTLRNLSATDRKFLRAMSDDDGEPSKIRDISARMGKDMNYVNSYRSRLANKDVIASIGNGYVISKIPYLMLYMHNEAAADMLCGEYGIPIRIRSKSRQIITDNLRNLRYDI